MTRDSEAKLARRKNKIKITPLASSHRTETGRPFLNPLECESIESHRRRARGSRILHEQTRRDVPQLVHPTHRHVRVRALNLTTAIPTVLAHQHRPPSHLLRRAHVARAVVQEQALVRVGDVRDLHGGVVGVGVVFSDPIHGSHVDDAFEQVGYAEELEASTRVRLDARGEHPSRDGRIERL